MQYYGQSDVFGWSQLVEIWRSRELLYSFFMRDLLIRYRQVFIGIAWVLLQPLISTLIFICLFAVLDTKAGGSKVAYASIVLVGMLCWQLVSNSLRDATGSLVNYRHVVTKIYFPRMLLPLSCLLCAIFDFLIGLLLLIPVCWLTSTRIEWATSPIALLAIIWLILFCFGAIAWLSSLNAHYRDVGYALPFAMQIGMFATPVVYDAERIAPLIGPQWLWLYEANPVATCIGLVRWSLFGTTAPTVPGMLMAGLVTVALVVSGIAWFQHADRLLADRI